VKIYSPFRIGLVLVCIASIWVGIIFSGSEKISYDTNLGVRETANLDLYLAENGLGFYTIKIPDYEKHVLFVQILDPHGNVIEDRKIGTKMSVNYFKFSESGKYSMEITNVSEKSVGIEAQFGNTRSSELWIPMFIAFFGAAAIVFSGYKRLSNHSTAQPEENIS